METNLDDSRFRLMTKSDVAHVFGVCTKTVDNYIKAAMLPPPIGFGAREYWHPEVFQSFIDEIFRPKEVATKMALEGSVPEIVELRSRRPKAEKLSDSSATVRQHARQAERLRHMNG